MIKRILLTVTFLCVTLLSVPELKAQEINASNVDSYQSLADSLNDVFLFDSAFVYYNQLSTYYSDKNQADKYLNAKSRAIKAIVSTNNFAKAEPMVIGFLEELNTTYSKQYIMIADMYRMQGLIEEILRNNLSKALSLYLTSAEIIETNRPEDYKALAGAYKEIGTVKFQLNEPDSAEFFLKKSIQLTRQVKEPNLSDIGLLYRQLGVMSYFLGNIEKAISYCKEGLKGLDKENIDHQAAMAALYGAIGNSYNRLQEIDSAFYYSNAGQELNLKIYPPTDNQIAIGYQNLGILATQRNQYDLAEDMLIKARNIALQNPNRDKLFLAYIYNSLGNLSDVKYSALQEAIDYFSEGLSLLQKDQDLRTADIRSTLGYNMGTIYLTRANFYQQNYNDSLAKLDLEKGIELISDVIKSVTNTQSLSKERLSSFHENLAALYEAYGDPVLSEENFRKSIELSDSSSPHVSVHIGSRYLGLAQLMLDKGDLKRYEEYASKTRNFYLRYTGEDKTPLIRGYAKLAKLYISAKKYQEAEEALSQALKENRSDTIPNDSIPFVDQLISVQDQSEIYYLRASLMEARYMKESELSLLHEAYNRYREFSDFVFESLSEQHDYKDLVNRISTLHAGYFGYVQTCLKLYKTTSESKYLEEALGASQFSRAILLKKSIYNRSLQSFREVPSELLEKEQLLENSIVYLSSKVRQYSYDSIKLRLIKKELFTRRQERKELLTTLLKNHPEYYNLQYSNKNPSLIEIQNTLEQGQDLIEYIVQDSVAYVFVINHSGLKEKEILLPENFYELVQEFNIGLQTKDFTSYRKAAKALYEILFKPVEPHIENDRVLVVPDGILWNINFDLLINDQISESTETNYLIKEYAFSYMYSSSSLTSLDPRRGASAGFAAFSFGDMQEVPTQVTTLRNTPTDLPGSAKEVLNLSQEFDGEFFFGSESTEAKFKQKASEYSVLHLAIHGEIDELDYDNSKLYFKPNPEDSTEDNLLYPFELYNMDIRANLVVLSACNSGSGTVSRGEGIMSLGRAFRYAGVKSLLLSKWEVSDGVAPDLMASFYKNLDAGMTKDQALRSAKLSFLETSDNLTENPFYWGSFFLLGDTSPIQLRSGINYTKLGFIFFLFIFSAMIAFRIRMKKNMSANS